MLRLVLVSVSCVLVCGGCSPLSLARRGLTEFRGASGEVVPIRECSRGFCQSVGTIEPGGLTNSIAPVCPATMVSKLHASMVEEARQVSDRLSGSDRALVDVDVTYYHAPGGVMSVVGKAGLLIGRARVTDGDGTPQGDLLVTVSSEAVRTGQTEMADVLARTLCQYIADRAAGP